MSPWGLSRTNPEFVPFSPSGCEGEDCSGGQTTSSPPSSSSSHLSSSVVVKSQPPSHDFLGKLTQVSSPNSGDRKHRDASAVLPFIGLTGSKFTLHLCMHRWGRSAPKPTKKKVHLLTQNGKLPQDNNV